MVQASQPIKKDSAPPWMQSMAEQWLYNSREFQRYLDWRVCETCPEGECRCAAPTEWLSEAGLEAYTAFTEALDEWVKTLIAGRPYDTPLVEWEHRELVDIDDAKEIAANQATDGRAMSYSGEADEMLYKQQDRAEERRELLAKGWNADLAEPCENCDEGEVMLVSSRLPDLQYRFEECPRCLGTGVQP